MKEYEAIHFIFQISLVHCTSALPLWGVGGWTRSGKGMINVLIDIFMNPPLNP